MGDASSTGWRRRLERAGLEVMVIVFGILLALATDAWWDERVREDRELGLLLALREEFEANAAELEATGRAHSMLLDDAVHLLELARIQSVPRGNLPDYRRIHFGGARPPRTHSKRRRLRESQCRHHRRPAVPQSRWKIRAERETLYRHEQVSVAHDRLRTLLDAAIARR